MSSYYAMLGLIATICLSPLQAAQYIEITLECLDFNAINASYARCINTTDDTFNIEKDAQIILPVAHGKHINIELDAKDLFSFQSLRNAIKETRLNDDFFILASYRHKLPNGNVSKLKHIDAAHLVWQSKNKDNIDPVTGEPIVSLDFHEFCHINKKPAVRHLGSNKTLDHFNTILNLSIQNSVVDIELDDKLIFLSNAHTVNNDSKRATKYIRKISKEYSLKRYFSTLIPQVIIALDHNDRKSAIELLKKVSFISPDQTFLLYKMYQDEPGPYSIKHIAKTINDVQQKQPYAMLELGNIYLYEASKDWSSNHAVDFLRLAHSCHNDAVKKHEDIQTIFHLMRDLTFMLNEKSHTCLLKKSDLNRYANMCIDAINQNNSRLQTIKEHIPLDYEKTLHIIKKYGTKEIII